MPGFAVPRSLELDFLRFRCFFNRLQSTARRPLSTWAKSEFVLLKNVINFIHCS